jgi:hypothetical protein
MHVPFRIQNRNNLIDKNDSKSQPFDNDLFFDENGRVKDLDEKLDAMLSHDDVTHDCIDDIVSDLQNIFIHTAKSTFGYTLNEPRSTDKNLVVPYEISKANFHVKKKFMSVCQKRFNKFENINIGRTS